MESRDTIRGLPPSQGAELLRLRVVRGHNLGKRDLFGTCSPYLVLRLECRGEKVDEVTLGTRKKTRNPEWNEDAVFRVATGCLLRVLAFDEHRIRKDVPLGSVDLVVDELDRADRGSHTFPLTGPRSRSQGSLTLSLAFIDSPSRNSPSSSSNNQDGHSPELPDGWEEREDANGRTFYVNHELRTMQWHRPEADHDGERPALSHMLARLREDYEQRAEPVDEVATQIAGIDDGMRAHFEGERTLADAGGALPEGWDMQVAPNGRTFFINHRTKTTTWKDPRTQDLGSDDEIGPLPEGWEQRVHHDGRVFFIDHNNRRTQWEDPRFENEKMAGPAIPYSRDYKRKVEYLRAKLPRPNSNGKCELFMKRDTIFEDSFRQIMDRNPQELRSKLWIEFDGETGLDYGGVAREWCFLLSHRIFNPYYGLFEYSATDNYTLQINPHSEACNPDHLNYFHFIGRVMGMAIYHGKLLDAFFIRPFYKMLLGKKITLFDMESVDNAYYNSLIYVKDNDPSDLDLTFSVDDVVFGQTRTVELVEGGGELKVTEENKEAYIEAIVNWRFVERVSAQMTALMRGLHEIVPSNLLSIFDANELELLMCGLQKIDVKDWRANTVYKGGYGANSQVVHNFWKCILSFDNEMRARVLQFVTGTSRVPMNGFRELYGSNGAQKFTIERWGSADMLPRAHTCFNRLDLPPYTSFAELKQKLCTAIENSEIFSGVD